jgi:GTPase SAR1 family protein
MDGKQGVNSEEQVNLLNLVKESMDTKEVPVIILCNKVDDPTTKKQAGLIAEARLKVEEIFSRLSGDGAPQSPWRGSQTSVLFGQYRQPLFQSQRCMRLARRVDES